MEAVANLANIILTTLWHIGAHVNGLVGRNAYASSSGPESVMMMMIIITRMMVMMMMMTVMFVMDVQKAHVHTSIESALPTAAAWNRYGKGWPSNCTSELESSNLLSLLQETSS